jgi:5-methylcytosine-specific restriction enzyme subunit McrC
VATADIPIRNVYFLLCYAWNRLQEGNVVDVSKLRSTELVDLFALVLVGGINHLARRGLEQGYQLQEQEVVGLRGRVDLVTSARRMLLFHGRTLCSFDELSADTLQNQILKATVRVLSALPTVDRDLRKRLVDTFRNLNGIQNIRLTHATFRSVQLHSNNRFYKFLLNVCELVSGAWLVDEQSGSYAFRNFLRDERQMARLFESFVFNFWRLETTGVGVTRERLLWPAKSTSDPDLLHLPRMETDITLIRGETKTIVDTKYYKETLSKFYDAETVHAANLYQIMAYVRTASRSSSGTVEGMLLYPTVDRQLRLSYEIDGFRIRVCTVNLGGEWQEIRDELLELAA